MKVDPDPALDEVAAGRPERVRLDARIRPAEQLTRWRHTKGGKVSDAALQQRRMLLIACVWVCVCVCVCD